MCGVTTVVSRWCVPNGAVACADGMRVDVPQHDRCDSVSQVVCCGLPGLCHSLCVLCISDRRDVVAEVWWGGGGTAGCVCGRMTRALDVSGWHGQYVRGSRGAIVCRCGPPPAADRRQCPQALPCVLSRCHCRCQWQPEPGALSRWVTLGVQRLPVQYVRRLVSCQCRAVSTVPVPVARCGHRGGVHVARVVSPHWQRCVHKCVCYA